MIKYYCHRCDSVLDEEEIATEHDWECGDYAVCPHCNSRNFVNAAYCEICEEWHDEDEVTEGICKKCLDKEISIETAIEVGEIAAKDCDKDINAFLLDRLGATIINNILAKLIKDTATEFDNSYAKKWLEDNIEYFAEWVKEQYQPEKQQIRRKQYEYIPN